MGSRCRDFLHRLYSTWMSVQVEFQGQYSVERLQHLDSYSLQLSTWRLARILLFTPLPSLIFSLAKEIPALNSPEAGVFNNKVFFTRSWIIVSFVNASVLVQMGQAAPALELTAIQVLFSALLGGAVAMTFIYGLCAYTVFPLPFGLLVIAPIDVLIVAICFIYVSGPRWHANPLLWNDVKRQLSLFHCQVALTFIYPLYIFGFVSLTGIRQAMFVLVLPVIQLIAKNWASRQHTNDDIKPEAVTFTVEVFNALYASNALHKATSWKTTAIIIALDVLQFWMSMIDVLEVLKAVKVLMAKIPRNHVTANESFVSIALRLLKLETESKPASQCSTSNSVTVSHKSQWSMRIAARKMRNEISTAQRGPSIVTKGPGRTWVPFLHAQVFPIQLAQLQTQSSRATTEKTRSTHGLELIFTPAERALFIQKSARVLYSTEYIVLVEYAEVVLPLAYSVHQLILYNMHNAAYYPVLASMTRQELFSAIQNVLLYSSLEFVTFVLALNVLKRVLGYSALQQLAFVLELQASKIQTKLSMLFLYILQVPLQHHGAVVVTNTSYPIILT